MGTAKKKSPAGAKAGAPKARRGRAADAIRVLLVRPLYAGNVGSVARVMKNLGFRRLGIVSDRDPRSEPEAFWMAHGAEDVLEAATLYPDLDEALRPVDLVIGTTSRKGARWQAALEPEALADTLAAIWDWKPTAMLFGPEDRGLPVRELARCRWVVRIPTREQCPSMNVSHAVGVICYVLVRRTASLPESGRSGAVSPEEAQGFIEEAESLLKRTDFLGPDPTRNQAAMRRLQRLFVRASPDKSELALLWALLRHVERRRG